MYIDCENFMNQTCKICGNKFFEKSLHIVECTGLDHFTRHKLTSNFMRMIEKYHSSIAWEMDTMSPIMISRVETKQSTAEQRFEAAKKKFIVKKKKSSQKRKMISRH